MIFLVVGIILAIPIIPLMRKSPTAKNGYMTTERGWAWAFVVFTWIAITIALVTSCVVWSDQISLNARIQQSYHVQSIANQRSNDLIPQFRELLSVQYPEYEERIFNTISKPEDVTAFLVRYPELKASKTILDLVKRMNSLRNAVYHQRNARESLFRIGYVNKHSPWILTVLVPGVNKERV